MPVFDELVRLRAQGKKSALALIVQCVGSSPQKEGAKMLVRSDGKTVGTLGGGSWSLSGRTCPNRGSSSAGLFIGSVTPAEIAVSTVAQMIEVRRSPERADRGAAPRGGSEACRFPVCPFGK